MYHRLIAIEVLAVATPFKLPLRISSHQEVESVSSLLNYIGLVTCFHQQKVADIMVCQF